MARSDFERQLQSLEELLKELGDLASQDIAALGSLVGSDAPVKDRLIRDARQAQRWRDAVEHSCFDMLLLQQPVAQDLRFVTAAFRAGADLARISSLCAAAAEVVGEDKDAVQPIIQENLVRMGWVAEPMVASAAKAFISQNQEEAVAIARSDAKLDQLHDAVQKQVVQGLGDGTLDPKGVPETLMVAKYMERIGDLAVRVASWGAFRETGDHLSAQELAQLNSALSKTTNKLKDEP